MTDEPIAVEKLSSIDYFQHPKITLRVKYQGYPEYLASLILTPETKVTKHIRTVLIDNFDFDRFIGKIANTSMLYAIASAISDAIQAWQHSHAFDAHKWPEIDVEVG